MGLDEIVLFLIYVSIYLGLFVMVFYVFSYFSNPPKKFKKIPDSRLPFVSIIVPAWNEEAGIAKTIISLKNMDYPKNKLEIIVVDDGSSDNTFKEALKYKSSIIKVFRKDKNEGKYTALNYGIKKSRGEIIVSTDADNLEVMPDALRYMVRYFENPSVMCVAPAMAINNPKNILTRVQQIEYLLGVFLRRAFASINAIHVTPGAFSAYRKEFIKRFGGFKRAHLTEDMEMALRIQKNGYVIENSLDSVVYTGGVERFVPLLRQRRRWYVGLIRNFIDYNKLFSFKQGVMGILVLPMAIWAIFTTIVFTIYISVKMIIDINRRLALYNSVNYNIFYIDFNSYFFERSFIHFASTPLIVFTFMFIIILIGYMIFAKRWVKKHTNVGYSLVLFLIFYSFVSFVWWVNALLYSSVFYKKIKWR